MVDKKEIEHLSDLVKIEIKDPQKYILQVEQILNYFERLDKVEITTQDLLRQELTLDDLREDKFVPYEDNLIEKLKKTRENFVRAPKMV
ncbi:MAG: Asp-tRNA(Asn)/Glu-tRNA(Gln) amidotransferase subunit GatC [Nitrosopumilaceae archaeon]